MTRYKNNHHMLLKHVFFQARATNWKLDRNIINIKNVNCDKFKNLYRKNKRKTLKFLQKIWQNWHNRLKITLSSTWVYWNMYFSQFPFLTQKKWVLQQISKALHSFFCCIYFFFSWSQQKPAQSFSLFLLRFHRSLISLDRK